MLTYDEAVERILGSISPLSPETSMLIDCLGRILSDDIISPIDIPPFDNSSMDGFAVVAADTEKASPNGPVSLNLIEEIAAGLVPKLTLSAGLASRIFTGAVLPEGADAIVPVEDTAYSTSEEIVRVTASVCNGDYVRRAGSDIQRGEIGLSAGNVIRPFEIAMAASMGLQRLPMHRTPQVALIATGNELVEPGSELQKGQIYNSNSYGLQAQVAALGCSVVSVNHATDNLSSLHIALQEARSSGADIIITSGGVSVGDYDLVKQIVEKEGGKIDFWKAAIRPGKPFVFGKFGKALFFGLPGNPVSTIVTFELFVKPALKRLAGFPAEQCLGRTVTAKLRTPTMHEPGRRSFQRAWTQIENGTFVTEVISGQSSHQLRSLTLANSLLIVPENISKLDAGADVSTILLD